MLSPIERKTLPAIAEVVALANEQKTSPKTRKADLGKALRVIALLENFCLLTRVNQPLS